MSESDAETNSDCLRDGEGQALLHAGQPRQVPAGSVLCDQGQTLDHCFVVVNGTIELSRTVAGETLNLGNCGPGTLLGLMAALDGKPCSVTFRAHQECQVVEISRAAIFRLLGSDSRWCGGISHDLALLTIRRLRRATDDLAQTLYRALRSSPRPGRLDIIDLARIQAKNHAWTCAAFAA